MKCSACPPEADEFPNIDDLEAHIAAEHYDCVPFECEKCRFSKFPTEFAIRRHFERDHRISDYYIRYKVSRQLTEKLCAVRDCLQRSCSASGVEFPYGRNFPVLHRVNGSGFRAGRHNYGNNTNGTDTPAGDESDSVATRRNSTVIKSESCDSPANSGDDETLGGVAVADGDEPSAALAAFIRTAVSCGVSGELGDSNNNNDEDKPSPKNEEFQNFYSKLIVPGDAANEGASSPGEDLDDGALVSGDGSLGGTEHMMDENQQAQQLLRHLESQLNATQNASNLALRRKRQRQLVKKFGALSSVRQVKRLGVVSNNGHHDRSGGHFDMPYGGHSNGHLYNSHHSHQQSHHPNHHPQQHNQQSAMGHHNNSYSHHGSHHGGHHGNNNSSSSQNGGSFQSPFFPNSFGNNANGMDNMNLSTGMGSNCGSPAMMMGGSGPMMKSIPPKVNEIQCQECKEMVTNRATSLNYHVNMKHLKYALFVCKGCGRNFLWQRTTIVTHVQRYHGGDESLIEDNSSMYMSEINLRRKVYFPTKCAAPSAAHIATMSANAPSHMTSGASVSSQATGSGAIGSAETSSFDAHGAGGNTVGGHMNPTVNGGGSSAEDAHQDAPSTSSASSSSAAPMINSNEAACHMDDSSPANADHNGDGNDAGSDDDTLMDEENLDEEDDAEAIALMGGGALGGYFDAMSGGDLSSSFQQQGGMMNNGMFANMFNGFEGIDEGLIGGQGAAKKGRQLQCNICQELVVATKPWILLNHANSHMNFPLFECGACHQIFMKYLRSYTVTHMKRYHEGREELIMDNRSLYHARLQDKCQEIFGVAV